MSIRSKQLHDCPCCTCGMMELTWSDREAHMRPDDLDEVAEVVLNCALDHWYDRTPIGVPHGLNQKRTEALAPIVAEHLSRAEPGWKEKTVEMGEEGRALFLADVRRVLLETN